MNIAGIQWPVFNPYHKPTVEIYISGCNKKCKGCHNPELQNHEFGKPLNIEELIKYLKDREDLFEIISITGGDLLVHSEEEIWGLIGGLGEQFLTKELWLFTGYEFKEIPEIVKEWFDKIKISCYNEELKQEGFPASSNQQLLIKGKDY